ncbi:hypothetical protein ACLK2A_14305 [Escherichia coli]
MTTKQYAYDLAHCSCPIHWYEYLVDVFRQQPGHEGVTQQTLTLTFNSSGVLTNIDNKPALSGN